MKAVFEKRGRTLVPIDDAGVSLLQRHQDGKRLIVSVHVPRSEKHFRLFWVLISKIVEAGAWSGDKESLVDWIQISMGRVRSVVDPESGRAFLVPLSMKAEDMGDAEFREFFDRAIQLICEKLLTKDAHASLKAEVIAACERPNYGDYR